MESRLQNKESLILNSSNHFLFLGSDSISIIAQYFFDNVLDFPWIIQLCGLERHNKNTSLSKMVYVYKHSLNIKLITL